jgi:purine-binding chemotaxis protein CheW
MTTDFATFYLGPHYFGINVADVLELNRNMEVTPVPKSPKIVRGIMNLRGQLVPAIDMYQRLDLVADIPKNESVSIILHCTGDLIAILVDDVGEILSLDQSTFEPPPSNFSLASKELVRGVHKLSERLLLIIDAKSIAHPADQPKKQLMLT